jgi:hypothetical protein
LNGFGAGPCGGVSLGPPNMLGVMANESTPV